MATTAQLVREWRGPAVLGFGFRPFYLLGAIWAALSMAWWIAALAGRAPTPALYAPGDWHGHALLFGYTSAAITGFILTAVPNWTGRLPVVGWRLGALVLLWLAGRAGMSLPLPQVLAAALDLALPTVLIAVLAREIIAGKNWRNLPVLGLIAGFAAAQALFHAGAPQLALRAGIGIAVLLITLIGGRIIPSFTRNWLVRQGEKALPAPPMARFDLGVLGLSILALAGFIAGPLSMPTALLCALAGAAHLARLSRW
ncbi:MAG: NnrS family protein, partial [Paracoccus sp. (in: a-proteobacteria)]|nr:NnrS family protein [Paracoccus sp. (in: a-proteobacteria)]